MSQQINFLINLKDAALQIMANKTIYNFKKNKKTSGVYYYLGRCPPLCSFKVTLDTFEKRSVFVETFVAFVFPKSRSLVSKCKIQNKTENRLSVHHTFESEMETSKTTLFGPHVQ